MTCCEIVRKRAHHCSGLFEHNSGRGLLCFLLFDEFGRQMPPAERPPEMCSTNVGAALESASRSMSISLPHAPR